MNPADIKLRSAGPLGQFWQSLKARLNPAPISTADELKVFLEERALFIAQKCAIDYCRGKTGLASYALFTEETFLKALDVCRWEAFAAILGDLFILVETHVRPQTTTAQRARLDEVFLRLHTEILTSIPAPVHRPDGWGDVSATFNVRFRAAVANAPQKTADVADHSAKRLFDTLPIHLSMRELDEEVVYGAVRFRMIALNQEIQRRVDAVPIIRQLAG